jgi:hypothetical protein
VGDAIEFAWGGERFRVQCSAPLGGGGERPVIVYLRPADSITSVSFGSGGAPAQYR